MLYSHERSCLPNQKRHTWQSRSPANAGLCTGIRMSINVLLYFFSSSPAALLRVGWRRKTKKIQRPIGFLLHTQYRVIGGLVDVVHAAVAIAEAQAVRAVSTARVLRTRPIVAVGCISIAIGATGGQKYTVAVSYGACPAVASEKCSVFRIAIPRIRSTPRIAGINHFLKLSLCRQAHAGRTGRLGVSPCILRR